MFYIFQNCNSLTSVIISDLSSWLNIVFGDNSANPLNSAHHLFINGEEITNLTIPNDLVSIGNYVFSGCSGLTSVNIPEGVTSIGAYAFYGCSGLTSVTIPSSVIKIGNCAFDGCDNLKSLVLPEFITKRTVHVEKAGTLSTLIPSDERYQIIELTLTGELNGTDFCYIRDMAGDNADFSAIGISHNETEGKLKSLDISNAKIVKGGDSYNVIIMASNDKYGLYTKDDVITIGLFEGTKLESIILPQNVTSIEGKYIWNDGYWSGYIGSFPKCLTSIEIPKSVIDTNGLAFYDCSGLESMSVESGNTKYDSRNNCDAIIETLSNTVIAGCQNTSIPNSVTSIGNYAFSNRSGLTSITIPNSVTSIGERAFYNCSGLTSVTIPNSVTSIGHRAFGGCSGLTSVVIGNGITSIDTYSFFNCDNLREMILSQTAYENGIPESVTKFTTYSKNPMRVEVVSKGVVSATMKIYPIDEQGNTNENNCYTVTTSGQIPGQYIKWKLDDENYGIISEKTEGTLTLETLPAQPISTTKARLIATVNEADDDQHFGFEWLRNDAPANMPANKVSAPLYDGRIIGSLGGLKPDIYYKYRPFYKSDAGEMIYGEWIAFLTGDVNVFFEPEVHTKEATVVTNGGAQLSAVFVEGTDDIQEKGFEYWPKSSGARAVNSTRGTNVSTVIVSGNNTSVTLKGLKSGVEYGYRSYIKTASKTYYGEEKSFKTVVSCDVNGDGSIDDKDLNLIVRCVMDDVPEGFDKTQADINGDGKVDAADVVKIVNMIK